MTIRKFRENDKSDFIRMCHEFYGSGAAHGPIPEKNMTDTFDYIIKDGNYVKGFIFEKGGEIAGYGLIVVYYSNEVGGLCGLLDEIYVSPKFQGSGLGSEYLSNIASILDEELIGLRLEVMDTNKRAIKLYEKQGFKPLDYKQLVKGANE